MLFSFRVYMDEKVGSPQRDLLIVGGQPISVRKVDQETVQVDLAEPYAAAERLFDSVAILPRHLLEQPYREGRLPAMWGLGTVAEGFAGLGPFRFKEHVPGQRIVLERNPFYWKRDREGKPLPYLDRLVFVFVPSEDAQAVRFQSGEADITTRLSAANFSVLLRDQGNAQLRAAPTSVPGSITRFSSSTRSARGESVPRDERDSSRGSASCRSGRRFRSRSTARASFASSIADGPRRSGGTSRRATSCG